MAFQLTDEQINTFASKGVREGDYIPNTQLRIAPDGSLFRDKSKVVASPTPTATPTVPPPVQTPANTPLSVLSMGSTDPNQAEYDKYSLQYKQAADEVIDPQKVYRDKLKMYQGEIDAVNQIYAQRLNQERLQAQGAMGSTAAIAGRAGTLGSDFGAAQLKGTEKENEAIRAATMAEQAAKIGNIMGTVRDSVVKDLEAKTLAKKQGAEAYMEYLKGASERRSTRAKMIAQMLLDEDLDPTQVNWDETLKGSDLKKEDVLPLYKSAKKDADAKQLEAKAKQDKATLDASKTNAEIKKIEADIAKGKLITIGEGTMLYDTETGETFKNPKTYAPKDGVSGSVSLTTEDKRTLLGGGWAESDIASIENDIRSNGLPEVIKNAQANGATPAQINALEKAYGATASEQQFLTKDYLKTLFGDKALKEKAKEAGVVTGGDDLIPFNESGDVDAYLNTLEQTIQSYRTAGYTDQEILKMMQK